MRTTSLVVGFAALVLTQTVLGAQPLVDAQWLASRLGDQRTVVLDIRNKIDGGSAKVYARGHIPGAVHSDYLKDGWRRTKDGVVGMLPATRDLEVLIGGLGISNDHHVVVVPAGVSALDYGSATRIYWTFKVLGHEAVSILDGGYALWQAQGRAVESGVNHPTPVKFKAALRRDMIASREDVLTVVNAGRSGVLVDNRPPAQFSGRKKHPKAVRLGAIPGASNIPQSKFYDNGTKRFAGIAELQTLWRDAGVSTDAEQITYCNTGHWASLGWFASSELLGNSNVKVYDGSMVEWAKHKELPMMNGQP